ncbi:hypothetical protein Q8A64_13630 [Oxalobacteraceae bacterium R-40]|uniref:Uncharacterized protein n=1 Tax=Keguizhuia sedimenti TaxID=3064264 RepID=A0ABU1BRE9_9BURK|nr:hypothetical protein [Oxalobacteraceae bacterium R-40]
MNKYQTKGMLIYLAGRIEETAGKFMHDSRRQVKGYQRKVTGQAIMALGDAHQALKLCVNARVPGLDGNLDLSEGRVRQTSKL